MIKIDFNEICNKVILYGVLGIFALGLHLITKGAIEGHEEQDKRLAALEEYHEESITPHEEPPITRKVWNWISFKEFRK